MDKSPPRPRGRPPKHAAPLSREAIVRATLAVIDETGLEGVGVRAVARALGVDPKSLYNHVDGKDGLLDAVTEHVLAGIVPPAPTGDLRTDLAGLARAFRDRALVHPEAASLVLTRQLGSSQALAPTEAVLAVLVGTGFPADEAVRVLRVLVAALVGTLLREAGAGPTFGSTDADAIAARRSQLESSGLPATTAAAPHLARFDGAQEFEAMLDLTLDAVAARLDAVQR